MQYPIHGQVAPGFERVLEVFSANFTDDVEVGASFCVIRGGETLVDLGLGLVTGIWRKRQAYRLPVDVAERVEALEDEIEDLRAPHRVSEPRGSYSWQLVLKVPAECQGPGEWFELGEVSDAEIEALEDDPGRMFEAEEGLIFVRLDEG